MRTIDKATVERGYRVADRLARFSERVDRIGWDLDAALSAVEKDKAGYRNRTAANRTGGQNYVEGELEAALLAAEVLLKLLRGEAEAAGDLKLTSVSVGGTYGRVFPATLAGYDAANAYSREKQLQGNVAPVKLDFSKG